METRKKQQQEDPDNWLQALILTIMFGALCVLLSGCRTTKIIDKQETVKVDSVVMYDTVYAEHHLVRYDTTYVYDSYKETYTIGKIDTIFKIRVDTVRVSTINYIYKERATEATDSAVSVKVDQQKQAATETRTVEKVVEKKPGIKYLAICLLAMVLVGAGAFVIGKAK